MELEKRNDGRILLSLPVQYKVFDVQKLESDVRDDRLGMAAELKDLSAGGLQVSSDAPFRQGDVLELELELPGEGKVRSVAKVVWCQKDAPGKGNGYHSGIHLIPVFERDLEKLKAFLAKGDR